MTGLQLTRRQYYALCTMVLLSPLLHLVPRKTTAEAGCGGWLCALAALVPLLICFFNLLYRNNNIFIAIFFSADFNLRQIFLCFT